jgi:hypothetical protein
MLILLTLPLCVHAAPAWNDVFSFGGAGTDIGQAVKTNSDNETYVTGAYSETAYFHQARPGTRQLTSAGGTDVFLAKYDAHSNLSWVISAGGAGDDQGFDIAFDSSRNVFLTGTFTDSATFHGTHGSEKTVTGNAQTIFLAKYNSSGVLLWVQTGVSDLGASNNGYGVAIDTASHSVYVTGMGQGDIAFSAVDGTSHTVPGVGTWHMYLVKYDTAGHFKWGETNEASPNTVAHKVAVDTRGSPYVVGWMEGQAIFHSNDGHDLTVTGFSQPVQSGPDFPGDAYVAKYDSNGNAKWVNHVGGYKGVGTEIATSRDGKVTITGIIGNIADSPAQASTIVTSQPGGRNINLGGGIFTVPFNRDVFVATYNHAGILLNARRFGGALDDGGSGLAYDDQNNLFLAGTFIDSIKFDGDVVSRPDPVSLFVVKFVGSDLKRLHWVRTAGGPGVSGAENDPRIEWHDGQVRVVGTYETVARFDHIRLIGLGDWDGFVGSLK